MVIPVRKGKYPESNSEEAIKKGEKATTEIGKNGKNRLEMFRFNPDKNLFPPANSYSKVKGAKEATKVARKTWNKNNVLMKPRDEQFSIVVENKKGGKVKEHLLLDKKDDYKDILTTAKRFAEKGKVAELMPEISQKEVSIRKKIFPNLQSKSSNPDLKVGNEYYDIKRPTAIKNILGRANDAGKQGAIAVISDSRINKPLSDSIMENRAKNIFKSDFYRFNKVFFLRNGELIVYNKN